MHKYLYLLKNMPTIQKNDGLDVLRACCALAVFLFHCGVFLPGWLGVQVFFVISGYLITLSIESRPDGSPGRRIAAFYGRRARRILPPLYIYLLLMLPILLLYVPAQLPGWWSAVSFTYNFYSLSASFENSYFLSHLWSFATEEQFYLLFPLLMILMRRRATPILLSLVLFMPLFRWAFGAWAADSDAFFHSGPHSGQAVYAGAHAVYVAGFTQLDAFAIGALLALHFQRFGRSAAASSALVAALGVVSLILFATGMDISAFYRILLGLPGVFEHVWGYSVIALLSATLVALFSRMNVNGRWRPAFLGLAMLGGYSYEFYIVHMPVVGFSARLIPHEDASGRIALTLTTFLVSVGMAILLHRWSGRVAERFVTIAPAVVGAPRRLVTR